MTVITDAIEQIPYFAGLSGEELEAVGRFIFEKSVSAGETILFEGDISDTLYFIGSGAVKMFKTSSEGKEQILSILRPWEPLNNVPVFDGNPNPASAQAMTPVVLYGIGKNDLESVLRDYCQIALNVIHSLAGEVRRLVDLVEDLSFKHVIERVARILLEAGGEEPVPSPRLTQQDMAAMAGTAREMVGRSLKALEESGAIRIERHRIIITDKQALSEIAESGSAAR